MSKEEKNKIKAAELAISQIEKRFGAGSIMRFSQGKSVKTASIPTGSISLDLALGVGGIPL